jgi:hypothetical protein
MESMTERADKYAEEQLNCLLSIFNPQCALQDARNVLLNRMANCWLEGYICALRDELARLDASSCVAPPAGSLADVAPGFVTP